MGPVSIIAQKITGSPDKYLLKPTGAPASPDAPQVEAEPGRYHVSHNMKSAGRLQNSGIGFKTQTAKFLQRKTSKNLHSFMLPAARELLLPHIPTSRHPSTHIPPLISTAILHRKGRMQTAPQTLRGLLCRVLQTREIRVYGCTHTTTTQHNPQHKHLPEPRCVPRASPYSWQQLY